MKRHLPLAAALLLCLPLPALAQKTTAFMRAMNPQPLY